MSDSIAYIGLDVHAESIAVAVADGRGEVRSLGTIPNDGESLARLVKRLGRREMQRYCYEAGPCGYVIYWQLTELGVEVEVIAPSLIPVRAGDRVKTDRRDARRLAQLYRAGELTAVWVPGPEHVALRDLVRARGSAKSDQHQARQRLGKFLLRQGLRRPAGTKAWSCTHGRWLSTLVFGSKVHEQVFIDYRHEVEHQTERVARMDAAVGRAIDEAPPEIREVVKALMGLRGVALITAATVVAEVGSLSRFRKASQLMAYAGIVPSEYSSGSKVKRGAITKTGNAHLRRVLTEAGWCNRFRPNRGCVLKKRQEGLSAAVLEISWKAQHRLHHRYTRLVHAGKPTQKATVAVGRELLGFIWSVAKQVEAELQVTTQH